MCLQALGKITAHGIFLEQLETNPVKYLPEITSESLGGDVVQVSEHHLRAGMKKQSLSFAAFVDLDESFSTSLFGFSGRPQ